MIKIQMFFRRVVLNKKITKVRRKKIAINLISSWIGSRRKEFKQKKIVKRRKSINIIIKAMKKNVEQNLKKMKKIHDLPLVDALQIIYNENVKKDYFWSFLREKNHWSELRFNKLSKFKGISLYPIKFYLNRNSMRVQWRKPKIMKVLYEQTYTNLLLLGEFGFTPKQQGSVLSLQKLYRRKKAWYWISLLFEGLSIMLTAEKKYFQVEKISVEQLKQNLTTSMLNVHSFYLYPNISTSKTKNKFIGNKKIIALANYVLYNLCISMNFEKGSDLNKKLQLLLKKQGKTINFAKLINLFGVATSSTFIKKDMQKLIDIVAEVKRVKLTGYQFIHFELGFLRPATLFHSDFNNFKGKSTQQRARQHLNYAIFLQFFGSCLKFSKTFNYFTANPKVEDVYIANKQKIVYNISDNDVSSDDYEKSEEQYLKALLLNPNDKLIKLHFSFFLKYLKNDDTIVEVIFRNYVQKLNKNNI